MLNAEILADRKEFLEQVTLSLGGAVVSGKLNAGELEIVLTSASLVEAMTKLRDDANLLFSTLIDV
ncbi:MAG: hypothetical protein ACPGVN_06755, partial [Alphaproteobacteria bacterium]